jgi:hypothetical protein
LLVEVIFIRGFERLLLFLKLHVPVEILESVRAKNRKTVVRLKIFGTGKIIHVAFLAKILLLRTLLIRKVTKSVIQ